MGWSAGELSACLAALALATPPALAAEPQVPATAEATPPLPATAEPTPQDLELLRELELIEDLELLRDWDPDEDLPIPSGDVEP